MNKEKNAKAMGITFSPLPYADSALIPVISEKTIGLHYGKHHKGYVDTLNKLIEETDLAESTLEEIIKKTEGKPEKVAIYNNAAQAWIHAFYWRCLTPGGGGEPKDELKKKIDSSFGSFDEFTKEFLAAAKAQFGSGWVWLAQDGGKLKVVKTGNADLPSGKNLKPLLVVDVWEHAYYLDYQNRRGDYVAAVLDKLINWDFVEFNMDN